MFFLMALPQAQTRPHHSGGAAPRRRCSESVCYCCTGCCCIMAASQRAAGPCCTCTTRWSLLYETRCGRSLSWARARVHTHTHTHYCHLVGFLLKGIFPWASNSQSAFCRFLFQPEPWSFFFLLHFILSGTWCFSDYFWAVCQIVKFASAIFFFNKPGT